MPINIIFQSFNHPKVLYLLKTYLKIKLSFIKYKFFIIYIYIYIAK